MLTVSIQAIYYIVAIVSIICGAAYRLGYETAKREMNYLDDNNESSGGKEKEEETKLVLKPD